MFSVPARFLLTGRLLFYLFFILFFYAHYFFVKGYFKRSQLKQSDVLSECLDQNVSFMYCVFEQYKKQWMFDIFKRMAVILK